MTTRNHSIPPALPCGDDPLVRTCGLELAPLTNASVSAAIQHTNDEKMVSLAPAISACLACLPRPAKLVKLEGV